MRTILIYGSLKLLIISSIYNNNSFRIYQYILLNKKSKNIKMGQEVVVPEKSVKGKSTI